MLDMGFEREMHRIKRFLPVERLTAMFSATWSHTVQDLARLYFRREPILISVGQLSHLPTANKSIKQYVEQLMTWDDKWRRLMEILNGLNEKDKVLMFSNRKIICTKIAKVLQNKGYSCGALSSDSTQGVREKTLFQFKKGYLSVLVATDVASRGLDIPDVEAVINFDFPQTIEAYVHRIGRTGRAGRKGVSYSFIDGTETGKLIGEFIPVLENSGEEVPKFLVNYRPLYADRGNRIKRHDYTHYNRFQQKKSPMENWNAASKPKKNWNWNAAPQSNTADLLTQLSNTDPQTLAAIKTLLQTK